MATEKKRKDNSNKNHRARQEWIERKRAGRPKQVYNRFALPAPRWEKVSA